MPEANDRRAIEAALPSRLFVLILKSIRADPDNPPETDRTLNAIIPELEADVSHALDGGNDVKRWRRLDRTTKAALAEIGGRTRATALLAMTYWISDVIGQGRMDLVEGSPFEQAYTTVVQIINADPSNTYLFEAVDKSAAKAARRLRERLETEGYYR